MSHPTVAQLQARDKTLGPAIDACIQSRRADIVADMRKILTFETVSGGRTEEERSLCAREIAAGFDWLGERARALGFEFRNHENIVCVIEQPGEGGSLGVLLHLDVVPPGEGWTHPPFSGELDNDVIYGRGCQDDKGPIIEALHALAAAKSLGKKFRRSVRLIVGSEEETGEWLDIKRYLELEPAPDLSIVPDAVFPIVNGEKGIATLIFHAALNGPDEGSPRILSMQAGERSNIVPHVCEALLAVRNPAERTALEGSLKAFFAADPARKADVEAAQQEGGEALRLLFHGKNAHGSTPWLGRNAARDAVTFLAGLEDLRGPRAEFVRLLASICQDDLGSDLGIVASHPFVGPTTQNLGVLAISADKLRGTFNIRPTMGQLSGFVLEQGKAKAAVAARGGLALEVKLGTGTREAIHLDAKDHPEFIGALQTAYAAATGREPTLLAIGGTTFAKAFPNAICFGPTDSADELELAHQVDERIHIDHLLRNVRIYGRALALLALAE